METVVPRASPRPRLWSPQAAAAWSLLFTPAFGAYLQALNWRELGDAEQANRSMRWFFAGLAMLAVYALLGALLPDEELGDGIVRVLGLLFLGAWFACSAIVQTKHVKSTCGSDYVRRPWGAPIAAAVAASAAVMALLFAVGFTAGWLAAGTP